jgi:hypothetical protein
MLSITDAKSFMFLVSGGNISFSNRKFWARLKNLISGRKFQTMLLEEYPGRFPCREAVVLWQAFPGLEFLGTLFTYTVYTFWMPTVSYF